MPVRASRRQPGVSAVAPRLGSVPRWLFALFLLGFCFGTDDLVIAGVLPDIAGALRVSVPVAGQAVTSFALTFAVGAPFAAMLTARLSRRVVLAGAAAVFVLANLGAAAAPGFPVLLVARVVSALAAATASPAAFAVAAGAAPAGRQGRFLAVVSAGLTTSLVVGVPIGTWIGGAVGWRFTMLFVGALALIAGGALLATLPRLPGGQPGRLRDRLAPLWYPRTALALLAMVPSGAGGMMSYVYVSEIAGRLGQVRGSALAPVITIVGLAGIGGTFLGGRAVDAVGPVRTLLLYLGGVFAAPVVMVVLGLAGGRYPLPVVGVVFALYGLVTWGIAPATQAWLVRHGGGSANELIALNTSTMFLGFSLAGALGGVALRAGGPLAVSATAAGCVLLGLVLFPVAFRLDRQARQRE